MDFGGELLKVIHKDEHNIKKGNQMILFLINRLVENLLVELFFLCLPVSCMTMDLGLAYFGKSRNMRLTLQSHCLSLQNGC